MIELLQPEQSLGLRRTTSYRIRMPLMFSGGVTEALSQRLPLALLKMTSLIDTSYMIDGGSDPAGTTQDTARGISLHKYRPFLSALI